MWHTKKILRTYATPASQVAYAYIDGVGWRRVKTGAADGVTNVFMMLNAARAHDKVAVVYVDASNFITAAYL
jgi:hypothetical protein